jgi:hypothetical protein
LEALDEPAPTLGEDPDLTEQGRYHHGAAAEVG